MLQKCKPIVIFRFFLFTILQNYGILDIEIEKGVLGLFVQNDLVKIKSSLSVHVGNKVKLTAKRGRKQTVTREGVIEGTYPSIFIVKLNTPDDFMASERRVSYSYTDILTRAVEVVICEPEEDGQNPDSLD